MEKVKSDEYCIHTWTLHKYLNNYKVYQSKLNFNMNTSIFPDKKAVNQRHSTHLHQRPTVEISNHIHNANSFSFRICGRTSNIHHLFPLVYWITLEHLTTEYHDLWTNSSVLIYYFPFPETLTLGVYYRITSRQLSAVPALILQMPRIVI